MTARRSGHVLFFWFVIVVIRYHGGNLPMQFRHVVGGYCLIDQEHCEHKHPACLPREFCDCSVGYHSQHRKRNIKLRDCDKFQEHFLCICQFHDFSFPSFASALFLCFTILQYSYLYRAISYAGGSPLFTISVYHRPATMSSRLCVYCYSVIHAMRKNSLFNSPTLHGRIITSLPSLSSIAYAGLSP